MSIACGLCSGLRRVVNSMWVMLRGYIIRVRAPVMWAAARGWSPAVRQRKHTGIYRTRLRDVRLGVRVGG